MSKKIVTVPGWKDLRPGDVFLEHVNSSFTPELRVTREVSDSVIIIEMPDREKLARAIHASDSPRERWEDASDYERAEYLKNADAVTAALNPRPVDAGPLGRGIYLASREEATNGQRAERLLAYLDRHLRGEPE